MATRVLIAAVAAFMVAACATEEDARTAYDPPRSVDKHLRVLARDFADALERCDVQRVEEILGEPLDDHTPVASADQDPMVQLADDFISGIATCRYRMEIDTLKVGHTVYDKDGRYPDAVLVPVSYRLRFVVDGTDTEWDDVAGVFAFREEDGKWHLVSGFFPD